MLLPWLVLTHWRGWTKEYVLMEYQPSAGLDQGVCITGVSAQLETVPRSKYELLEDPPELAGIVA